MLHRRIACAILILATTLSPAAGLAAGNEELAGAERAGRIGWDLLVLRPLGVVLTAVSLVGAAVAYPMAWPFGGAEHVTEYLVNDPIDRTFRRPLGEL